MAKEARLGLATIQDHEKRIAALEAKISPKTKPKKENPEKSKKE